MLPHLFLCRHGETSWNADRRIQGQMDIPLNDLGRRQAARNGARLRERLGPGAPGWAFLASPLARTRETMEILRGELGLDPADYPVDARLMELNFGEWQGFTLRDIAARMPGAVEARETRKWDYVPAGGEGESYAMLEARMAPVFEGLARRTIVVAHGGIARCFLRRYGGTSPQDAAHRPIPQDRILEYEDGRIEWI